MTSSKNAALRFIFITLLLDVIGLSIVVPVLPRLIEQLIDGNISRASQWSGWLLFAYAIMQFICAPIVGNLSDKYGRRPVLLLSLLGFGIDYIFLWLAPTIWWLFLGRIIAGMFGASITTASAYIADISTNENRAKNFGMIGAAFGLGYIIGPVLGGLLSELGARIPFIAAAILTFLNAIYGYFTLPESLPVENRRPFEWKRSNPLGSLVQLKKHKNVSGGLIITFILLYIADHAVMSTWSFINIEKFGWSNALIGLSLTVAGIMVVIVQAGLIRIINPKLGNEKSIFAGLVLYTVSLLLFAFASQSWMMFIFLIPYCLGGITGPSLRSIISRNVPQNQQGELQGSLTSLMSVTSIIGPLLMTNLFTWFTGPGARIQFAGAPFLLGAVLMMISVFIAVNSFKKTIPSEKIISNDISLLDPKDI
ncbi:Tetracycline resistance protein, class C [Flavobacterium bizetiae]|uniref:Tetracycline resistance protein, class C n=1 Tax=Flavobacterium bizetiae TaxID=2704140 RepID=A0A6J4G775_9FLAO|nr:TCR/Tet family MFS transporter [Flavobacterium bizetiae]CAA9194891.1 Tetracycline resistance protein, class C [Flavobacterium bizetiae]CAD5342506.1 Tetracycline resistance protein, class C [Flavobacterium bizetiae]CAD5348422.1 Tetracycline resistance protein, class C [Flavobacterium bizetiae]